MFTYHRFSVGNYSVAVPATKLAHAHAYMRGSYAKGTYKYVGTMSHVGEREAYSVLSIQAAWVHPSYAAMMQQRREAAGIDTRLVCGHCGSRERGIFGIKEGKQACDACLEAGTA